MSLVLLGGLLLGLARVGGERDGAHTKWVEGLLMLKSDRPDLLPPTTTTANQPLNSNPTFADGQKSFSQ